jgi:hypothetical protein
MPVKILNINNDEDSEAIRKTFKGYIKIEQEHYKLLPTDVFIKFIDIDTGEIKNGGYIIKHQTHHRNKQYNILLKSYPNIIRHINPSNKIIFVKDDTDKIFIEREKTRIYNLFKEGLIKIVNNSDELDINAYCEEHLI